VEQNIYQNLVQMRPWPKICEVFYNPDPIRNLHNSSYPGPAQSKSLPMLISGINHTIWYCWRQQKFGSKK